MFSFTIKNVEQQEIFWWKNSKEPTKNLSGATIINLDMDSKLTSYPAVIELISNCPKREVKVLHIMLKGVYGITMEQ